MQIGATLMTDTHNRLLGNRALSPETLMMGYGYDPFLSERSLKPPVFHTSTFVFRSARDGKEFFELAYGFAAKAAGSTIRTSKCSRIDWLSGIRPKPASSSPRAWRQSRPRCGPMRDQAR